MNPSGKAIGFVLRSYACRAFVGLFCSVTQTRGVEVVFEAIPHAEPNKMLLVVFISVAAESSRAWYDPCMGILQPGCMMGM